MHYFLIYVSTAAELMSASELYAILGTARSSNASAAVTGALLYRDGTFMQVLEGERQIVRNLFDRICDDPRHRDVLMIVDGETSARQFDDWSMAFRDLSSESGELAEGFEQLRPSTRDDAYGPDPSIAQKVLLTFRRSLAAV